MTQFLFIFTILTLIGFAQTNFSMQNSEVKELKLLNSVQNNDVASVIQLLEEGVNPNIPSFNREDPYFPLIVAIANDGIDIEISKQLLKHGASPEINKTRIEMTPLHYAVKYNHGAMDNKIKLLFAHKADVNAQDCNLQTPIIYAARYGKEKAISLLLQKGAHLNHKDKNFDTALSYAAEQGQLKVLEAILSNTFVRPNLHYGLNNAMHVFDLAKKEYLKKVHDDINEEKRRKQTLQRTGKALIIFEGFWTHRNLISRNGLAAGLPLPLDLVKYIAACFNYKSILFPPIEKVETRSSS